MIVVNEKLIPSAKTYCVIRDLDLDAIERLDLPAIRPILPTLVRMGWCVPLDTSDHWSQQRKNIQKMLSGIEVINNIVHLLSIDFHALEMDVRKEQQLRFKVGVAANDSLLISALTDGLALEFERCDGIKKLRLLLSELISLMAFVRQTVYQTQQPVTGLRPSELFDNEVYLDEVSDVLCIAISELPNTLLIHEVIEALLHVKNGTALICRIAANFTDSFADICLTLLNNGDKQEDESFCGRTRMTALRLLCQMNPSDALTVRSEAVDMCRMPSLTIMLTLDYIQNKHKSADYLPQTDIVSFINGILLGNDDRIRNWFSQYIRSGQKCMEQMRPTSLIDLRSELLKSVNLLVENGLKSEGSLESGVSDACVLIRLYCALRAIANMKFTDEETNALISLIICRPPANQIGIRFVSLGLCMILSSPLLISSADNESKVIQWIKWLVKEESYFGRLTDVKSSFGEMLLLIAIHFHSNQLPAIGELVSSTLGIKIPVRTNNMNRIKVIFTQEIFIDQTVTTHAVKVPVTQNLNSSVAGFLPVHCIYQLLKSRAFTKHKVPIKDWIFKQICNAVAPIHTIFLPLIEIYVNSIIHPNPKVASNTTNEPFSEEEILLIFRHKVYSHEDDDEKIDFNDINDTIVSCPLTSQLLLLYFVLLYEDNRLTYHSKNVSSTERKIMKYSPEFLAQIPIFYLIQSARYDQQNYGAITSPLLRLIAHHYPHLCLVKDWLSSELSSHKKKEMTYKSQQISTKKERKLFENSFETNSPSIIISELDRLMTLPKTHLWPLAPDFILKLPSLFCRSTPRKLCEKAKIVWFELNSIFPRKLWVMTVNVLRPKLFGFAPKTQSLTWSDIMSDPLHVLRCDERIFRNAELMEITLHMLSAFLAASRINLSHHLMETVSKSPDEEKDREELRSALLTAQESAAIQILLECCIAKPEEMDTNLLTNLREVQGLICSHLHQVFISDTNIAKLVHFQGYDSELLPLVVTAIPSMHICLDFIPELLGQPDLQKQAFAINLCSHLCKQYSITKSFNVSKLCFNVAVTLVSVLPSDKRAPFFTSILPALVQMCAPFPLLCEDAVKLLIQLSQINMSCLASTSSHFMYPEATLRQYNKKLECLNWQQLNDHFSNLPIEDSLSLCIQKAFISLSDLPFIKKIY
ncbi:integrator complex subunit 2-like [Oppia nitens]|uniref:integrator complex subunit 2-like n=1 Tax=Oppia nitens TaxID=1686743 RepID=UPI0023DA25C5|nr:integrator complex subunit 2-like [Oppia nitens]